MQEKILSTLEALRDEILEKLQQSPLFLSLVAIEKSIDAINAAHGDDGSRRAARITEQSKLTELVSSTSSTGEPGPAAGKTVLKKKKKSKIKPAPEVADSDSPFAAAKSGRQTADAVQSRGTLRSSASESVIAAGLVSETAETRSSRRDASIDVTEADTTTSSHLLEEVDTEEEEEEESDEDEESDEEDDAEDDEEDVDEEEDEEEEEEEEDAEEDEADEDESEDDADDDSDESDDAEEEAGDEEDDESEDGDESDDAEEDAGDEDADESEESDDDAGDDSDEADDAEEDAGDEDDDAEEDAGDEEAGESEEGDDDAEDDSDEPDDAEEDAGDDDADESEESDETDDDSDETDDAEEEAGDDDAEEDASDGDADESEESNDDAEDDSDESDDAEVEAGDDDAEEDASDEEADESEDSDDDSDESDDAEVDAGDDDADESEESEDDAEESEADAADESAREAAAIAHAEAHQRMLEQGLRESSVTTESASDVHELEESDSHSEAHGLIETETTEAIEEDEERDEAIELTETEEVHAEAHERSEESEEHVEIEHTAVETESVTESHAEAIETVASTSGTTTEVVEAEESDEDDGEMENATDEDAGHTEAAAEVVAGTADIDTTETVEVHSEPVDDGHPAGYIPMKPQPNSAYFFASAELYKQPLPKRVDLRPGLDPVVDQGRAGSAVADAIATVYDFYSKQSTGEPHESSRLFIYYNARWRTGTQAADAGCAIQTAIDGVRMFGASSEALWPFDRRKVTQKPSDEAYAEASPLRIAGLQQLPMNLNAWRQALAEGKPILFGAAFYEDIDRCMESGGVVPMPSADVLVASPGPSVHALCCVGYSDAEKVFIVRNTWGKNWGDDGYCYIPYNYILNKKFVDGDCWVMIPGTELPLPKEFWSNDETPVTNGGHGVSFEINPYEVSSYWSVTRNFVRELMVDYDANPPPDYLAAAAT